MDVRIDPEASSATVGGAEVSILELHLGGVPRGAVVVLAGPQGLDEMGAVDMMNRLAQHGYESVLALPASDPDDDTVLAIVQHLTRLAATRGWTREQTAVIGYGHGSRAALLIATRVTFGAVVSIPRAGQELVHMARSALLLSPWLGLIGLGPHDELSGELAVCREQLRDGALEHADLVGYRGVEHCLRDATDALTHAAAFDSWQRTAEWLNLHVAPRPTPLALAWLERQQAAQSVHG
jgi:hypothetical protein